MRRPNILLVDDEPSIRFGIREYLSGAGYEVAEAATVAQALETAASFQADLVLTDFRLPDGDALELMPKLRARDPGLPIILITGFGTVEMAVKAMQLGADHVYTKPVELPMLLAQVQRLLEQRRSERSQRAKERTKRPRNPFLGISAAIHELEIQATRVAQSQATILLTGETGSGKGLLARWIAENGPRRGEAFVALNCGGFSRELLDAELFGVEKGAFTGAAQAKAGLLEVAHQGTVFLDEIGDLSQELQPKLLKVLEEGCLRRLGETKERTVDLRLISATHQNLNALIEQGQFREDLYYRLNTVQLRFPALRERPEDIPALAQALLEHLAADMGRAPPILPTETLKAIQSHPWRGNVRELRNALERALVLSDGESLEPGDVLPAYPIPAVATDRRATATIPSFKEAEKKLLQAALKEAKGSVPAAAKLIELPLSTFYDKLKTLGITVRDKGGPGSIS